MGELLGIAITRYPPLLGWPEGFTNILRRVLASPVVPADRKDPSTWPAPMREEYAAEKERAYDHQARLAPAFRSVPEIIDDFAPDAVVVFGDEQDENVRDDWIPPFCSTKCCAVFRPGAA